MTMTKTHDDVFQTPERVGVFARTFGGVVKSILQSMQCSRMESVLDRMSDRQLADIGLQRGDIADYSKWLIYGKGANRWDGAAGMARSQPRRR